MYIRSHYLQFSEEFRFLVQDGKLKKQNALLPFAGLVIVLLCKKTKSVASQMLKFSDVIRSCICYSYALPSMGTCLQFSS